LNGRQPLGIYFGEHRVIDGQRTERGVVSGRQPVKDSGGFSSENQSTTFWGLYLTHWFDLSHNSGIDLYYLGIYNERATYASGTADEHRHSFGLRVFGRRDQWDWNEEDVIQTGSFGNNSILAWTASLDAGYTWVTMWQPRLGLKAAVISGSGSTNGGTQETFDALYPNPDYINDASVLRPANFMDVHPNIAVNPARNVSVNGGADIFWRYSRNDAVYSPSGYIAIVCRRTNMPTRQKCVSRANKFS
jgi:hypothetical protein